MPRADRADARPHRAAAAPTTGAGPTRSSGTACGRSATPRAAGCGSRAATGATSRPATRSCASSAARWPAARPIARRRGRRLRRGRAAELPAPPAPHAPHLRARRAPALAERPGRLRDLRPAVARRPLAARPALRRAARAAGGARAAAARRWQTPAHHVGDGAAMLEASRAQGLEGIIAKRLDCPYTPGRRSPGWVKVKNVRRTDVVSAAGCPARAGAAAGSARSSSASTRTASCATPAGWAPASTRPSSTASAACSRRWRAARARSPAASRRRRRTSSSRARGSSSITARWTQARTLRHPVLQGPARRHRPGRRPLRPPKTP